VEKLIMTAIEYPPMQRGPSFNLDAVKAKIEATHRGGRPSEGPPALLRDDARGSAKTWTKQERLTKGDHNS